MLGEGRPIVFFPAQVIRIIVSALEPYQIRKTSRYEGNIHACPWQPLVPRRNFVDRAVVSTPAPLAARQELGWRRSSRYGLLAYAPPISSQAAGAGNTVEQHLYGSWKLGPGPSLAQPDGKCRERATAPISLPGVEACGPVLSFGLSNTLSFCPSRVPVYSHATKSRKVLREPSARTTPNYVPDEKDISWQKQFRTRLWCFKS